MDIEVLERALARERKRRAAAENLLEEKSRELYHSYTKLEKAHNELRDNKDKLVQSEKMASLGVLSAGVAHEINNPIGFIQSNLNTLSEYAPIAVNVISQTKLLMAQHTDAEPAQALQKIFDDKEIDFVLEDAHDILKECRDGIRRVQDIVSGLKEFSHMDNDEHDDVNVNELIENALNIAKSQFKTYCEVEQCLAELPAVKGNSGRLRQVFMNLIVNAGQALPDDGGKIRVASTCDGGTVTVTVEDNGCGISEEHKRRLFEPFFTTKDVGEGTGLGLSISLGIIEDHGGALTCESVVGEGTTFALTLPVQRNL